MNNKKIGIIGGVGPQSTAFIYEKIIQFSQSKYHAKNNSDYPRLVIESVPVPDFISNKESVDKAKEIIRHNISNKKISFFPNLPVASLIGFNYNRKLWLK